MIGSRIEQRLPRKCIALILAGGRGNRLMPLTTKRSKPAVYFGGKFRIIDFALSNCINSGIRRISVVTQYKSHSLLRHLQRGWNFMRHEFNEYIEFLPAQQRLDEALWYRGTADAIFQNLDIIRGQKAETILILAGDHVYKMDYTRLLEEHNKSGKPCTVACIEVDRDKACSFGVLNVNEKREITDFIEKPCDPTPMPGSTDRCLASMGIYVFKAEYLYEMLSRDLADSSSSHDFGKDLIPAVVHDGAAHAHFFKDSCVSNNNEVPSHYWRDVGSIDSYWESNIDLTAITPSLNLYDEDWPIWTFQEQLPPAKFVHNDDQRRGMAVNSIVSGGCIVSGSYVKQSVLFSKCRLNSFSLVEDSLLLPSVEVGQFARLKKVIVDRGCRIPSGLVVGEDPSMDAQRFYRSEGGVTVITREMLERLGYPS